MNKKQRQAKLQELWGKHKPHVIADELGVSVRTLQRDVKELELQPVKEQTAEDYVHDYEESVKLRDERRKSRVLADRLLQIERELQVASRLRRAVSTYTIRGRDDIKSEATAFAIASDWHIEEMVYSWQVNDLNEFNAEVCKVRVERFFRHTLKLVRMNQHHTKIDTLVLALLGDFISGSIHDELMEGNRLLPADAIIEVMEHLASGIKYLLANSELKLVIPCSSGN